MMSLLHLKSSGGITSQNSDSKFLPLTSIWNILPSVHPLRPLILLILSQVVPHSEATLTLLFLKLAKHNPALNSFNTVLSLFQSTTCFLQVSTWLTFSTPFRDQLECHLWEVFSYPLYRKVTPASSPLFFYLLYYFPYHVSLLNIICSLYNLHQENQHLQSRKISSII